jgi:pimeloyl-ACP methyl ester carboxylesterase|tara:strand:- start:80 stop:982 length:903 start_codon:yes stop_codon:yes gene_type:complete
MSVSNKVIIFVPGIRPKPPAKDHQDALWRCLLAGVEQLNPATAESMAQAQGPFQVVPWSFEYYRVHADITPDLPGIEALLKKAEPSRADLAEAGSLQRRFQRWLYSIGDSMPFIGRLFASEPLRLRLSEIARYFDNSDRVADRMRFMVKAALLKAWQENKKVMLIGHSFGSVIAYDALWELGHVEGIEDTLDTFISMGSPMGLSYVRRDLKGARYKGAKQFPINIRYWRNIAAIGEVTAHHPALKEMQQTMAAAGWLNEASNHNEAVNFFRGPDGLNVHKCYGYFYNAETAQIIVDWWNA